MKRQEPSLEIVEEGPDFQLPSPGVPVLLLADAFAAWWLRSFSHRPPTILLSPPHVPHGLVPKAEMSAAKSSCHMWFCTGSSRVARTSRRIPDSSAF